MRRIPSLLTGFLLCLGAQAQEVLRPLHYQPREASPLRLKADLNTWFIYQYDTQVLPLQDDFSIDRTRHLNATPGDADVTPTDTVYLLEVGGVSTADMAFALDTTWHYTVDTVGVDTLWREANPNVVITLYDLTTYPSPTSTADGWPLYTVWDTVGLPTTATDTVPLGPDIVQDSLMVYTVAPDTRTYRMGLDIQPLILWEEDRAYINGNYPVDPPTIGVATLDGMDRTGLPYSTIANLEGRADELTSVPIDLAYDPGDSIYLSFFYQPQGLSGDNQVQTTDTLMLEMYAPLEDNWYRQWYTTYTALAPFKQVMLPITDTRFLHNGFRMRFANRATLNGALDHWHIDYVRLAVDRAFDDTVIVDMGHVMPIVSLLDPFTAMPFDQYAADPGTYMAPFVLDTLRNLDVNDRFIIYGVRAGPEGGPLTAVDNGNNTSGNASSKFSALGDVSGYQFDPAASDTCEAFYTVELWSQTSPDGCEYNDTLTFTQEMSNFYAYDDGSAEAGYSLNVNGAKLAYQFSMVGGDSLKSIRMYFDPIFSQNDPTDGNFLLTVWSSLAPETIVHQNFTYSSPDYLDWGPDHFIDLPLDSAVWVENTFYIGWTQTNAIQMNLGFDRNLDNSDRIFFKTSTSFVNTSQVGSLMMRPVFKSNCDPYTAIAEPTENAALLFFPNPASDLFTVKAGPDARTVSLADATGREVKRWTVTEPMSVGALPGGLYLVRTLDGEGRTLSTGRLIVQH